MVKSEIHNMIKQNQLFRKYIQMLRIKNFSFSVNNYIAYSWREIRQNKEIKSQKMGITILQSFPRIPVQYMAYNYLLKISYDYRYSQ